MPEPSTAAQVKVLLVDDRPENLLALEAILQGLGHRLLRAGSGEEALKQLLSEEVSLILLDVQMPGMDGFETAEHIKQREKTRDIPIVFLTALEAGGHQAFRGYAAGAVDYLAKPFDPWVLRAKVSVLVELHEQRRALQRERDLLRSQAQRDAEEMLVLLGGAEDVAAAAPPDVAAGLRAPLAALRERLEARRR
ncbi:hypothetical protein NUM3379_38790 [Kineococcus sp. NUM-3379]